MKIILDTNIYRNLIRKKNSINSYIPLDRKRKNQSSSGEVPFQDTGKAIYSCKQHTNSR